MIGKIMGFGDYSVSQNSLMTNTQTIPTFSSRMDGLRVKHREFIVDITGSTAFATSYYQAVTPVNGAMFPWLADLAGLFEEYRVEGLVFEYRPTSSDISTASPAMGTVLMAGLYDVYAPAYLTKQALESYEYSTSVKPSQFGFLPIECRPSSTILKNLLTGPWTGANLGESKTNYQLANVQIATQGQPSAYVCGELWVTYDIVFEKPRISSGVISNYFHLDTGAPSAAVTTSFLWGQASGAVAITAAGASAVSLARVAPASDWTAVSYVYTDSTNIRVAFGKPGTYLVMFTSTGATSSVTGANVWSVGVGATLNTGVLSAPGGSSFNGDLTLQQGIGCVVTVTALVTAFGNWHVNLVSPTTITGNGTTQLTVVGVGAGAANAALNGYGS